MDRRLSDDLLGLVRVLARVLIRELEAERLSESADALERVGEINVTEIVGEHRRADFSASLRSRHGERGDERT